MRLILPGAAISVWARSGEQARRLAQAMELEASASVDSAVAGADVVCTVTASPIAAA